MSFLLGIDVSTTATKAVLVDERGAVAGIGVAEYGFDVPRPTWSEQDPALWWDGSIKAIRDVLASTDADPASIAAVGLTGQMHGLVLLDASERVLRPAILWNDQRTAHACDEIRDSPPTWFLLLPPACNLALPPARSPASCFRSRPSLIPGCPCWTSPWKRLPPTPSRLRSPACMS